MKSEQRIPVPAWMTAPETCAVTDALGAKGAVVRFVGGCVRDTLLARPVADFDLATPDSPEVVIALLEEAGLRAIPTGIEHGTITAVAGCKPFEVTTLRHDVETFGRHARVSFTDDWEADSTRRDFTINAIYCDLDGSLYDPQNGERDLRAGRVRFVGEARERIAEDVLRLLRFFRFHAWLGRSAADEEALIACREAAAELDRLSAERVWRELKNLLAAPDPAPDIRLMEENGILEHVLPEMGAGTETPFAALIAIEAKLKEHDPLRRLAILLGDNGVTAKKVATRLKLSNAECDRLAALTGGGVDLGNGAGAWRRALYTSGAALFRDLVLLAWATENQGDPQGEEPYRKMLAEAHNWTPPCLPATGEDVLALGIEPGEAVGDLLVRLENWWIAGDFRPDRKDCLEKLKALSQK